jgi:hypothetical protein
VKVVGVRGAEAGNGAAGLRPGRGELGVGVDDAADLRKFAVEQRVRIEIARRAQRALDDVAIEIGDDKVGGVEAA